MKQAVSDWQSKRAGDDEPPVVQPSDVPNVITTHYVSRPRWCSGGLYTVRHEAGKPLAGKTKQCSYQPVWPTDLCEDCTRRERDHREDLRAAFAPEGNGGSSRKRWE